MSLSLRDQRLAVYTPSDGGADGRIAPTYTFAGRYWGRVAAPTGAAHLLGGQLEHTADVVIALPRRAAVVNGGLVVGPQGAVHRIVAMLDRRRANEWQVLGVRADDALPNRRILLCAYSPGNGLVAARRASPATALAAI